MIACNATDLFNENWRQSATAIQSVAGDRTPNLPIDRQARYNWAIRRPGVAQNVNVSSIINLYCIISIHISTVVHTDGITSREFESNR